MAAAARVRWGWALCEAAARGRPLSGRHSSRQLIAQAPSPWLGSGVFVEGLAPRGSVASKRPLLWIPGGSVLRVGKRAHGPCQ